MPKKSKKNAVKMPSTLTITLAVIASTIIACALYGVFWWWAESTENKNDVATFDIIMIVLLFGLVLAPPFIAAAVVAFVLRNRPKA